MALEANQKVGPYSVVAPLGAGGMGEVWLATDTRLGRDVALKTVPEAFTSDLGRLSRFEREARILASLNHPNIAQLYGLEEHGGHRLLVMECVQGEDLAHRLKRGPLPLDEALAIARQISEALEEAHGKGIVHRDLKPANIKVTREGKVKVLDFGLAKAWDGPGGSSPDLSHSPTATLADTATAAGVVLGTAAYMSPEQARGRAVDKRTDIWAFGVVLFEMLTGHRLFGGETVSDTLAAVLKTDPDWSALPAATPPAIRRLLARSLLRDPKQRLHDVADVRLEIDEALGGSGVAATPTAPTPPPPRPRRAGLLWAVSLLVTAAAAAVATWLLRPRPVAPVRRFEMAIEKLDSEKPAGVSPDGRRIAFVTGSTLRVRDLDRVEPRALVTKDRIRVSFWSPDSRYLGFVSEGKLWKIAATGGEPMVVTSAGFTIDYLSAGGAWLDDGRIVFAPAVAGSGLLAVRADGGDFSVLHERRSESEAALQSPSALPGGGVLVVVVRRPQGPDTIAAFAGGKRKDLLCLEKEILTAPVYSPSGHVLYRRASGTAGVWAFPFSLAKLERTGEPFLVVPGASDPSVSADGTLVYSRPAINRAQLAWVDREGKVVSVVGDPRVVAGYVSPELSPDGRRLAVVRDDGHEGFHYYAGSASGGPLTRLSYKYSGLATVAWLPAGDRVLFDVPAEGSSEEQKGIFSCAADGSGGETRVVSDGWQPWVTRDGRWLVYVRIDEKTLFDVWALSLQKRGVPAPGATPEPVIVEPNNQMRPRVSPDGRLLAYTSNDGGWTNLHVRPFPRGSGRWQVSTAGAHRHAWSADGARLYWQNDDGLWEAEVRSTPTVEVGSPRLVFPEDPAALGLFLGFAVSPDGRRFLVVRPLKDESARPPTLTVVENWFLGYESESRGKARF